MRTLKIATRKSPLAMQQALLIKDALVCHYPKLSVELLPLETSGDQMLKGLLANVGGKGLFVKELELALLDKKADFAVHSMKDVPTIQPDGLELAVICKREDPRDAFISIDYEQITDLPDGAKIGTASLRRQCQLHGLHGHLDIHVLRGNIHTRLKRLHESGFDAIILAAAGLKRMGLTQHVRQFFTLEEMLPSAGQGALGLECRTDDIELKKLLAVLSDPVTTTCLEAERALTHRLGGNCRAPVAAFCEKMDDQLFLRGLVGSPRGDVILSAHRIGKDSDALGISVAEELLSKGAGEILRAL
jgi:hydroxymethylbilane synthase